MVGPCRRKYAKFSEEIDLKGPHFKIGMKFTNFKQFRKAVRNYGIKHRIVMNFKPNNSKGVKQFARRDALFVCCGLPCGEG